MRALLALPLILIPVQAQAQMACGRYDDFVKVLSSDFHEKSIGKGIAEKGTLVLELFVSSQSFTILSVNTAGHACILRSGDEWIAEKSGEDT